jgi:Protein of unknown function (DUF2652)
MSDESVSEVILAIADIGGYTKFMVSSKIEIEHSQFIITQLIEAIIKQIKIPLQISKLEGDAIFFFAVKQSDKNAWKQARKVVGAKLIQFFDAFHDKLDDISRSKECSCGACSNIKALKLKIIIHSGLALFYQIGQFNELSGKDVILTHRLLKNSVGHDEYILMTDSAYAVIEFPMKIEVQEGWEDYEHLGEVKTLTYLYQHHA